MSCMMGTKELYSKVGFILAAMLNSRNVYRGYTIPKSLYDELERAECGERLAWDWFHYEPEKIAAALYDLNAAAYNGRYRDANEIPPFEYVPQSGNPFRMIDVIYLDGQNLLHKNPLYPRFVKALEFIGYQLAEDATDKHPLKAALRELCRNICEGIAQSLPEYNATRWGTF